MDAIRFTSILTWCYSGNELPAHYLVKSTKTPGLFSGPTYTMYQTNSGHDRSVLCEYLDGGGAGGICYVTIVAVDGNNNQVASAEFEVNILEPSQELIAPTCFRIIDNT